MTRAHGDHCVEKFVENPNRMMLIVVLQPLESHMAYCRHETACGKSIPPQYRQEPPGDTGYDMMLNVTCFECGIETFYDIDKAFEETGLALEACIRAGDIEKLPSPNTYMKVFKSISQMCYVSRSCGRDWEWIAQRIVTGVASGKDKGNYHDFPNSSKFFQVVALSCVDAMQKAERYNPHREGLSL